MAFMFNNTGQWTAKQVQVKMTRSTTRYHRFISTLEFITRREKGLSTIRVVGVASIGNGVAYLDEAENVTMS